MLRSSYRDGKRRKAVLLGFTCWSSRDTLFTTRRPSMIQRLLDAFDGHDVDEVRAALADGADPRSPVNGKLPIEWLTEQYTRSHRLPICLRLLLEHGAKPPDPLVVPILLDDADAVRPAVRA